MVQYVQVVLPRHEALLAAGTAVESLYIGRIRRKPELLAASVLAGVSDRELPEHGAPVHQVLRLSGLERSITLHATQDEALVALGAVAG